MYDSGRGSADGGLEVVPYKAAHFMALIEQDEDKFWGGAVRQPGYARMLEQAGPAHTMMRGDQVLCCAGVIEQWEGRAIAWSIMAPKVGNDYIRIHRAVSRFLDIIGYRRIEMTVAANFKAGRRWAEMLGFKCETPQGMKSYGPDGGDHYLYARIKK